MNERHLAGLATVGLLLLSTGCAANGDPDPAPDPAADVTATSDDGRGALRTVSVEASRYFDPTTPDSIRQWGSYLALVTLTGDSEIPQVINPAPGGPEEPMAGPSMLSKAAGPLVVAARAGLPGRRGAVDEPPGGQRADRGGFDQHRDG